MRDDVLSVRISMSESPVRPGSSVGAGADHFSSTTKSHYQDQLREGLSFKPTVYHKNLSSLPGFMGPPTADDRFTTTSASAFTGGGNASQVRAAGTPRHLAQFKTMSESHTKDVFGMGGPSLETVTETSAHAMNSGAQGWPRARTPRFVNGGAFRNASTVPLDKNSQRLDGTAALHDFATTSGTAWWPGGEVERPMSRYERPQKNTSTYMATSMAVHTARTPEHKPREHYGHVNPRTEPLTSRPKTSANQFREPPIGFSASSHFLTTNKQHFPSRVASSWCRRERAASTAPSHPSRWAPTLTRDPCLRSRTATASSSARSSMSYGTLAPRGEPSACVVARSCPATRPAHLPASSSSRPRVARTFVRS